MLKELLPILMTRLISNLASPLDWYALRCLYVSFVVFRLNPTRKTEIHKTTVKLVCVLKHVSKSKKTVEKSFFKQFVIKKTSLS